MWGVDMGYLEKEGLTYFWTKIKAKIAALTGKDISVSSTDSTKIADVLEAVASDDAKEYHLGFSIINGKLCQTYNKE